MYLNCHTAYSYRFGTFSEEELLGEAQRMGITSLALTDVHSTSACLNFIRRAPNYGIRPVVGIDFREQGRGQYFGLAKNNQGYYELNTFLAEIRHNKAKVPIQAPWFENAFIIYDFAYAIQHPCLHPERLAPHEFIGVNPAQIAQLLRHTYRRSDRMIAYQSVTFRNKRDYSTHRLLRAIQKNTLLSKLSQTEQATYDEIFRPPSQVRQCFSGYELWLNRSQKILDQCHIEFDFSPGRPPQNQQSYTGDKHNDVQLLRQLCNDNISHRYSHQEKSVIQQRVDQEIDVIQQMDFVPYFLINWDIVQHAQKQGFFYVGRGSGANSILAYLLGITNVDPIELDLYFERFINVYRKNPPDFDIDFSWRDRQAITDYIFKRFKNVALLGAYNTFQYRAALREMGKVFGLPKDEIDRLIDGRYTSSRLDEISQLTLRYAHYIHDMPNHLSIHSSGILIAEKHIHHYASTDLPPKGFPTAHFDMHIAEDVGLFKYDILGQRGLAKIKETIQLIHQNQPDNPPHPIDDIQHFKQDPRINQKIAQGGCVGCFYVESPAMRMLLSKLQANDYLTLVAASSVIRPGVARSGMMREFILRHRLPERRKEAHQVLLEIMPDTYGIMVYQEDVIKVAHAFAHLTLGEADVLRRGMSGKYRSRAEFRAIKTKFFKNCTDLQYGQDITEEVWRQIESFAGYAFAKGHSASYAVESYQALYLKTYYPLESMVAIINNGGGFYRTEFYIHEARMQGGEIEGPCINNSVAETTLYGKTIYLGFSLIKDLQSSTIQQILEERKVGGAFASFHDFSSRLSIGLDDVNRLIRIRAFRDIEPSKTELLWQAQRIDQATKHSNNQQQQRMFQTPIQQVNLVELPSLPVEDAFDAMELLGFPLINPFELIAGPTEAGLLAQDLPNHIGKVVSVYGYLVTIKNTSTIHRDRMLFGTFLDREGHFIDTTHFPEITKRYPVLGRGVYHLTGKVAEEFGVISIEVSQCSPLPYVKDPRYST